MDFNFLWHLFDILGTVAFAISGSLVGISRRMDIFGVATMALATAVGGGIIRDSLIGNVPPISLRSSQYIGISVVVTVILAFIYQKAKIRRWVLKRFSLVYVLADAVGLASFTVTGATVGYLYIGCEPVLITMLALLTAVGGGILRDILAQRIPVVLREEVYALAAIFGGVVFYGLMAVGGLYLEAISIICFALTLLIRLMAIGLGWNLPKIHQRHW